ncbi:DUF1573 domain-containing protein [Litoribacter ruber]|uniref:DUF1573 domain-containing protein n=1 Tax=Litoribacter ruber TaxID=702568 RepID=UPI001BD995D5|nr:DUF1573 domain-containing protein [Litoribacter ruber]MBT0811752.1 DUF1573 domain-containing protein [Litoribacter ruber]
MRNSVFSLLGVIFYLGFAHGLAAQSIADRPIIWEKQRVDLGMVMEESGMVTSDFYFVNRADFPVFIQNVETDCGCTVASYTTDTLYQDKIGEIKVAYDPTNRGGQFSKMVIVKTNIDSDGDTLFLEGYNLPYPENVDVHYSHRVGDMGFKFTSVNVGDIINNEPKTKYVDFFNFKDMSVTLNDSKTVLPDHIKLKMSPAIVPAKSRGILEITYDGEQKGDLGFFDERIQFFIEDRGTTEMEVRLLTTVHEYFPPVKKSEVNDQPKLGISDVNVNLSNVSSNRPVSNAVTLSSMGGQPVNIRKVVSNCECLQVELRNYDIAPGDKEQLRFTFDPRGRQGLDHKTITIFSNDPLSPTRTILIKSSIK